MFDASSRKLSYANRCRFIIAAVISLCILMQQFMILRKGIAPFIDSSTSSAEEFSLGSPVKTDTAVSLSRSHHLTVNATAIKEVQCRESPAYRLHSTNYSKFRNISNFMTELNITTATGSSGENYSNNRAVCRFRNDLPHAQHFPHTLQQLYRCWSWWRHNSNMIPVLQWQPNDMPLQNPFLHGFLKILNETLLNLEYISLSDEIIENSVTVQATLNDGGIYDYAMASPDDAIALRHAASAVFKLPNASGCHDSARISILNRRKNREILNIDDLHTALEPLGQVQVEYFEKRPLQEQIHFMMQSDILVSPHGAQLTSIPWLPKCAAVVEIFPTGYFIPPFFGTLAAVSGAHHSYIYLGTNITREVAAGSSSPRARMQTRAAKICPPASHVQKAVRSILESWKRCCAEQSGNQLLF